MGGKIMAETHIISTIVEHRPGVLYEVSNMFRRKGFNIESISVGSDSNDDLARMTITVRGDEDTVEQVIKQLHKLIDVIKVVKLDPSRSVIREMALVKVHVADSTRSDVIQYANIFRGNVVDVAPDSLMIELTGDPEKINAFIELMQNFGVKEVARTGITALQRGGRALKV
jgi:acetolactate synthase-1/3 small subunit